jgi:hypothetical protein
MRPLVVLAYRVENVWTGATRSASDEPLLLENRSAIDAYDIVVAPIAIDERRYYELDPVPALPAHGSWPLGVHPDTPSIAAGISRRIVDDALAGRALPGGWPVRIYYRDDEGRGYTTWCELRVVRLPLAIEAVVLPDRGAATAAATPVRSSEALAAGRR